MIHFIVTIQQAIQTQKKLNKQSADKRKGSSQGNGNPAPSVPATKAEQTSDTTKRRKPFWKRWLNSGK